MNEPQTAFERLVARFEQAGHPYPLAAAQFATGGDESQAANLLVELATPQEPGFWIGTDSR